MSIHRSLAWGLLLALIMALWTTPARALDRAGLLGVGGAFPVEIEPDAGFSDPAFHLDVGYFLEDRWAAMLTFDFHLKGDRRVIMEVGPQLFFLDDFDLKPYLTVRFLLTLRPRSNFGWRGAVGVEWDLVDITDINNLRLFFEVGAAQLYLDQVPNEFLVEPARLGLSWSF